MSHLLDWSELNATFSSFGERSIQVRDTKGDERETRSGFVDHDVEPGRIGETPHHFIVCDDYVWSSTKEL
jgi:hypothetical protein